jgi:asparagine synthetase B (glutamine-hydrolysing)
MTDPIDLSKEFIRLSALESGLSLALDPIRPVSSAKVPQPSSTARVALESILLDAVSAPPCYVLFSGGRDSSAVLAVATHVARREGLPDPVPVTAVHPAASKTDETSWQAMVLAHLRIQERIVLSFDGEQTLLSRVARSALERHGLVWPEAVQLHGALYKRLDRGCVVSGEGGDQVLGSRRITPVQIQLRHRPTRSSLRAALRALSPNALSGRRQEMEVKVAALLPWLTPIARAELAAGICRSSHSPLRWDRQTLTSLATRPNVVFITNFETAIREYRHHPVNPFFSQRFIETLATEGGFLGLGDRTAIMRYLFADLLPDAVLSRTTKASFNQTRWGEFEREYAQDWSGEGIDPDLISAEKLRAAWLREDPLPAAAYQLHAAWLATSISSTAQRIG